MTSTQCAYCERFSHFTIRWGEVYGRGRAVRFAATCDNCSNISIARGPVTAGADAVDNSFVRKSLGGHESTLEWWPKTGEAPSIDDVPGAIARAAREAYSSANIQNHMAAILMARTVVEATAKSKGISSGNLKSKIDAMREQGLIRPAIAEQAHEIRFMGNDMAHGDIEDAPAAIDAEEILALMGEVLSEVFQGPARLERIRGRRTNPS